MFDIGGRYDYRLCMASIHKDPRGKSPFWYCAFYGADGRRMFRSTKATDRKMALKICFAWERLPPGSPKGINGSAGQEGDFRNGRHLLGRDIKLSLCPQLAKRMARE